MNGDGVPDLIVGSESPFNTCSARTHAWVVFGPQGNGTLPPGSGRGFEITGATNDRAGVRIAGGGDVNGDGLADVVVAAPTASPAGRSRAGAVYVVFGSPTSAPVDLQDLGDRGFEIQAPPNEATGSCDISFFARAVDGVGDVNGDGFADIAVTGRRESWVVFGGARTDAVDLAALGARGFVIDASEGDYFGHTLAGAGDVNGDGRADLIVGQPGALDDAGAATVVYGKADSVTVNASAPGSAGLRLNGVRPAGAPRPKDGSRDPGEEVGASVDGLGDVDSDGLSDVIIDGGDGASIVLGRRAAGTIVLNGRSPGVIPITGVGPRAVVSGAGDLDGDGVPDAAIFAYRPYFDAPESSTLYAVYGRTLGQAVDLDRLGGRGFRVAGNLGSGVAPIGDIDRDGRGDLAITSSNSYKTPLTRGAIYIIGPRPFVARGTCVNRGDGTTDFDSLSGTDDGDRLAGYEQRDVLLGLGGDDCLYGGEGDDIIEGDAGNDRLDGGPDNDALDGGDGNDTIAAGKGRDSVVAGAGNDTIDTADGAVDRVDCGPGRDRVRANVFDRLRGCEVRRLLPGSPRACLAPKVTNVRVTGVRQAGRPVTLTARGTDRDGKVELDVAWGDRGRMSFRRATPRARRARVLTRHTYAAPGRYTIKVSANSNPAPGCGEVYETVEARPLTVTIG